MSLLHTRIEILHKVTDFKLARTPQSQPQALHLSRLRCRCQRRLTALVHAKVRRRRFDPELARVGLEGAKCLAVDGRLVDPKAHPGADGAKTQERGSNKGRSSLSR